VWHTIPHLAFSVGVFVRRHLDCCLMQFYETGELCSVILPGMLFLQAIHAFLQLLCRLLQLEAAPMQLVADLQHAMDAFDLDCRKGRGHSSQGMMSSQSPWKALSAVSECYTV